MKKIFQELIPVFAAVFVPKSLATFHIVSAESFPSSTVQAHLKQGAMKSMITDGLRLANHSSQQWQEKLQHNPSYQQEQPLITNEMNIRNDKLDNHSPSVISELAF